MAPLGRSDRELPITLIRWLRWEVFPRLDAPASAEIVRTKMPASQRAVLCRLVWGTGPGASFVLKEYYRDPGILPREAGIRARRELQVFPLLAGAGLAASSGDAVRLLAGRTVAPAALALEFVEGRDLASLLKDAATGASRADHVEEALRNATRLLSRLHGIVAPHIRVWRSRLPRYPYRLLHTLAADGLISEREYHALGNALERFGSVLQDSHSHLVHGDANPTNFVVRPDGRVTAVDFERSGACDPGLDLGFLLADIRHLIKQYGGAPALADRLADATRTTYDEARGGISPERYALFETLGLWRIARNRWLSYAHRRWLVACARNSLKRATC